MLLGITLLFMFGIITVMLVIGTIACCLRNRCKKFLHRHPLPHYHHSMEFHQPAGK